MMRHGKTYGLITRSKCSSERLALPDTLESKAVKPRCFIKNSSLCRDFRTRALN